MTWDELCHLLGLKQVRFGDVWSQDGVVDVRVTVCVVTVEGWRGVVCVCWWC